MEVLAQANISGALILVKPRRGALCYTKRASVLSYTPASRHVPLVQGRFH